MQLPECVFVIAKSHWLNAAVGSSRQAKPQRATIPAYGATLTDKGSDVVFSRVAQNDLFFTGAAIINLSDQSSTSTVEIYDTNGQLTNTGSKALPPRGRDAFVLTEMFPGLNISAGYFRIRPTQPMASFAIFGTHDLRALSAIPPQTPPSGSGTTTSTTSASSSTTLIGASTTTTTSSTTTTIRRPPFNPSIVWDITPLAAGGVPNITGNLAERANDITMRSFELLLDAGRVDFANLTAGRVIGESQLILPGAPFPLTFQDVVVSNDGTTVRTEFRLQQLGALADGLCENVGAEGVRFVFTLRGPFASDDQTNDVGASRPVPLGRILILLTPAGRTFTARTTLTSVLFRGTASSVERTQSFTTTP